MVGRKETVSVLNNTLIQIVKLLNTNNIDKWFICYGTLLGLVRENNCINGDDDIDIIIHKSHYDTVKNILILNNFELTYSFGINNSRYILKTVPMDHKYSSIDIYFGEFGDDYVFDLWNKLKINNCYLDKTNQTFVKANWAGQTLYLPNNYTRILANRYGEDWKIKKDKKIPQSMTDL